MFEAIGSSLRFIADSKMRDFVEKTYKIPPVEGNGRYHIQTEEMVGDVEVCALLLISS
jgi:hypothetical protein